MADPRPLLWILEDYPDLRSLLSFLAAERGWRVGEFESIRAAEAALEAVSRGEAPVPDWVISDFRLGDGFSLDWLARLRQERPDIHVLCVSGSLDPSRRGRLAALGVPAYEKPVQLSQILDLLEKYERKK